MPTEDTLEKGSAEHAPERKLLAVTQPEKLANVLETIDLMGRVTEKLSEGRSGNMGAAGGSQRNGAGATGQPSARAQAIANLPDAPEMQRFIEHHICREIRTLRRDIRKSARRVGKPGSAYRLNELTARVRRLNGLLSKLFDAGYDVVRRLFIRICIDKHAAI